MKCASLVTRPVIPLLLFLSVSLHPLFDQLDPVLEGVASLPAVSFPIALPFRSGVFVGVLKALVVGHFDVRQIDGHMFQTAKNGLFSLQFV